MIEAKDLIIANQPPSIVVGEQKEFMESL
jgi:hypothetical protein